MPTVAEQLRAARESLHLTVNQVAETTKIRGDHIRALEMGNYDVFVAPVYIRGFTRTYAGLLKLDVPAVMAELEAELGATEKFSEPPSLTGRERTLLDFLMLQLSRLNLRTLLVVLLGLAIAGGAVAGYLAWRERASRDSMEGITEGVYRSPNPQQGETLPLPTPGQRR